MYDRELAIEILHQIVWSAETIQRRFKLIESPEDFLLSDEGLEKLDSICMQLIAMGESLKNLDKITRRTLLPRYTQVEWRDVIRMRDVISHHYFSLDAEVVYNVCANHIDNLAQTVAEMIKELSS
jgi:uncharacterized protein with HEPN domain